MCYEEPRDGPSTLDALVDPGAEAFDTVDGDLTSDIEIRGSVNIEQPGVYPIEYSVSDKVGNKSITLIREVVIKNSPPLNIELSSTKVEENVPSGTIVGKVMIVDPDDPGDARNYAIWMKEMTVQMMYLSISMKMAPSAWLETWIMRRPTVMN